MCCLRCTNLEKFTFIACVSIPQSLALRISCAFVPCSSSVLEGMQPTFKQVPLRLFSLQFQPFDLIVQRE